MKNKEKKLKLGPLGPLLDHNTWNQKMDELFAFIVEENGIEKFLTLPAEELFKALPITLPSFAPIDMVPAIAELIANNFEKKIKVVKYSRQEVIHTFYPYGMEPKK